MNELGFFFFLLNTVIYLFLLCVILCDHSIQGACAFPENVRTTEGSRDWRSEIRSQNTNSKLEVIINETVLTVKSTSRTVKSHQRACFRVVRPETYIVYHEEDDQQDIKYACIKFIMRSDNVLQISSSDTTNTMSEDLCREENMKLNDWIIVDNNHVLDDRAVCPFSGGFSVLVYDKLYGRGVCDVYQGETRIESECMEGEGFIFFFRSQSCVPEGLYMYSTQPTYCLASWEQGAHVFILARHDEEKYMWILRFPLVLSASFTSYVIKDLIADTTDTISQTRNYLRMDTVRDTPRPITALCVDDYEACSVYRDPCNSNAKTALSCRRTCGICTATRPILGTFNNAYHGQWYNAEKPGKLALTVNDSSLTTYDDDRSPEQLHVIQWDPEPVHDDRNTEEMMLVRDFENGCRPRYSCTQILHNSNSVLFFKLSLPKWWPIGKTPDAKLTCSLFEYDKDKTLVPNSFRNPVYSLLYSRTSNKVSCELPYDMTNYTAQFDDGTNCPSSLTETSQGRGLSLTLGIQCHNKQIDSEYTCVDSTRIIHTKSLVIVSRSNSDSDLFYCWVMPKQTPNIFYLVSAKDCNDAIRRKVRRKRLDAIITFTKIGAPDPVPPSRPKSKAPIPIDPTDTYQTVPSFPENPVDKDTSVSPTEKNSTTVGNVSKAGGITSAIMIVGLVLVLAIINLPNNCRRS